MASIVRQAEDALIRAYERRYKPSDLDPNRRGWLKDWRKSLVPSIDPTRIKTFLERGQGGEVQGARPKFAAIRSSAALAANSFGRWLDDPHGLHGPWDVAPDSLELEVPFDIFDLPLPKGAKQATANLDVVLYCEPTLVAIESKCLEYLDAARKTQVKNSGRPAFSPAYKLAIRDDRRTSVWFELIDELNTAPDTYRFLDAPQLVKHALGLMRFARNGQFKHLQLIYLYWEPVNWDSVEEFQQHREEIDRFAKRVANSPIKFRSGSYNELWDGWTRAGTPDWIADFLNDLRCRYFVTI